MIHDDMICKYDIKTKKKAKLQRKAKLEYNNQNFPPLKGKQTPSSPRKRAN